MMRRLLVVSPHFPPVNAPDLHRVRISLNHLREFGWEPEVLAVEPSRTQRIIDPALLKTIPVDIPIHHASALSPRWTRRIGFSAIGLRAWPFLYRAGTRLIRRRRPDLIFFSTTAFPILAMGRLWKRRFGVPFVIDLQDPWVGDYYDKRPANERPPKYFLAQRMHRALEAFTMRDVGGVVAVSEPYHATLRRRYPWIKTDMCRTIEFGASKKDFEVAKQIEWRNPFFTPGDGLIHGAFLGVLGRTKTETTIALCMAFKAGLEAYPELFSKVRLHFVGTDYVPRPHARETIRPIAAEYGLEKYIFEQPQRIPHLAGLRFLSDADFLLLLGSDDPTYTASKIYPYILTRKPILSVFREESSVTDVLKTTCSGQIVSFNQDDKRAEISAKLMPAWTEILLALPFTPPTDWKGFEQYEAREMTRRQCGLFDYVIKQSAGTQAGAR